MTAQLDNDNPPAFTCSLLLLESSLVAHELLWVRCSSGVLTSGCNVRSLHADHSTQLSEMFPLKRPGQELPLTVAQQQR